MGQVSKFGLMGQNMKVNGNITKQMEEANFGMLMVMFTKEIGKMIRQMAMEFTFTLTEPNMKDSGRTICKMDMELNHGLMEVNTQEGTKKV